MTDISAMTPTERLALITRRGSAPTPAHLVVPFKMAAAGEFIGAPVAARFFPEMNANEIFEAVPIYIADLSPNFPPVPCVQLDLALMMRPTLVVLDGTRVLWRSGPTGSGWRNTRSSRRWASVSA